MTTSPALNRSKKTWPAISIALLAAILLGFVLWRLDSAPQTDDAYMYADTISVVPEVSGRIIELPVHDNQAVKQGQVLLRVDPRSYQDAVEQAEASLVALDKQIALTQRSVDAQQFNAEAAHASVKRERAVSEQASDTLHRMAPLLAQGFASAEEVDQASTAQRSAQAALDAALLQARQAAAAVSGVDALLAQRAVVQAQIAIARLNLEYTTVRAPFDGRVASLKTAVGQFASASKPVFTLIDTRHWYVVANFRETELRAIHPGTPAMVYLMLNTRERFQGTVDSISYGVSPDDGGSVVDGLPQVQRGINWVHVAQRFPVKILINQPDIDLFRIGASATAILHSGDAEPHSAEVR